VVQRAGTVSQAASGAEKQYSHFMHESQAGGVSSHGGGSGIGGAGGGEGDEGGSVSARSSGMKYKVAADEVGSSRLLRVRVTSPCSTSPQLLAVKPPQASTYWDSGARFTTGETVKSSLICQALL